MYSLFLVVTVILATQAADWNYTDFNQWTVIDARCGNPTNQSPRNLTKASSVLSQQCRNLEWSNNYARDFKVKNNGHGITMTPVILPTEKTANTFTWGGTTWCLEQFHFHWSQDSHGAEHRLESFDNGLEVHFVHRDCRFDSLTQALTTEKTTVGTINAVAVIGVMYEVSNSGDAVLTHLLNDKVITNGVKNGSATSIVKGLDYTHMLPNIPNRRFYSYQGSLTTPTCDPVLWFVVESQGKVTTAELALLRGIKDKAGVTMQTNQRPVQANGQTLHFYKPCPAKVPRIPNGTATTTTTTSKPMTTTTKMTTSKPNPATTKAGTMTTTKTMTTSPCPNNNANAADTSSSSGIETGTFVGAVVGCLIGGLLIGAIVVHVCVLNHVGCYGDQRMNEGGAKSTQNIMRAPSTES